jgi:dephospho-CoA kinase
VSNWPGKYVIGLTGNIATGKSVILTMLEQLGTVCFDADQLSHAVIAKDAPGYPQVIDTFGKGIVDGNGEIDRAKLGRLVFSDPEALRQLEGIIHPLVEQAMDRLIQRASERVIVVEAIKLLESKLAGACDSIWTVVAPESIQKARLMQNRNMNEQDAIQRIYAQPPQAMKIAAADVVIPNTGSIKNTRKQVLAAWKAIPPAPDHPIT